MSAGIGELQNYWHEGSIMHATQNGPIASLALWEIEFELAFIRYLCEYQRIGDQQLQACAWTAWNVTS